MRIPASTLLRQAVPTLALALALTSCSRSTSVPCSAERACPEGWACSADGQTCIQTVCGDSVIQAGEVCDDGNNTSGDGCNSTCTSNEQCGNGYVDAELGEQCDDKNTSNDDDCLATCKLARCGDGVVSQQSAGEEACDYGDPLTPCNLNCTTPQCGDGLVTASTGEECDNGLRENTNKCNWNCTVPTCGDKLVNPAAGEECDDGNEDDTDDCLSTCKLSRCGDSYVNMAREACDDGNTTEEARCAYGSQSCETCNGSCTAILKLKGSYCGDNKRDPGEACDDGNTFTEKECPRGTWSCRPCNADCSEELDLSGAVCGNGTREWWAEICDDGNTESCGSCSADCGNSIPQTKAKGAIKVINAVDLVDGETFILNDGLHVPVVFEFDKTGSTTAGHIAISIDDSHTAENVAAIIRDVIHAIPNQTLAITATVNGSTVTFQHSLPGGTGNQSILKTVTHPDFSMKGMSGGRPYACSEGIGCVKSSDCERGLACVDNLCTEP